MKKLVFLFFAFHSIASLAQTLACGTDNLINSLISEDYDVKMKMDAIDNSIANNNIVYRSKNTAMINIPIVVYVVHDNQPVDVGSNISDAQVQDQIIALNSYYNNYGINFCFGTKLGNVSIPNGTGVQSVPGIIHYNSTLDSNHNANNAGIQGLNNLISVNRTNRNQFLRIWVVKNINGIASPGQQVLGYSMLPNISPQFDGVVIRSDVFGNGNPNLIAGYDSGKVLVHEIGHFLGLYHTFQNGCTGMTAGNCLTMGDKVCDTPPVNAANFSCITGTDSCTEPVNNRVDLIHNYMDYGDNNCADTFTDGQIERILNMTYLNRSELISDENLIYTGVSCASPNLITAKFTPTPYYACFTGNSISFAPMQASLSYSWNFGDPGSGTNNTSTASNPTHSFSSAAGSPYTVTLTVASGSNTAVYSTQVYITNCTTISGADSNWYASLSNAFNFATGIPVVSNVALPNGPVPYNTGTFGESCAFQSNSSGTILFYTNGYNIYNGTTNAVVNSTLLKGNGSAKSGALIVPNPAVANQYYVFLKDAFYGLQNYGLNGFTYSKVNVSGTTVTMASTNVSVTTPTGYNTGNDGAVLGGEGIVAAQKCDGYWIATTLKKPSGNFIVVYSLTAAGFVFNSEIQLPVTDSADCFSSMKFSPDGNKLVFVNYDDLRTDYLYDFNKFTGILSNRINLGISSYGASFSPDSKLLYLDSGNQTREIPALSYFYQFDITASNIPASRRIINTTSGYTGDLQIGPDNKLYGCIHGKKNFVIIHNPNVLVDESNSNACNFTLNGITANTLGASGMPNLINAKLTTAYSNTISATSLSCTNFRFFANACGSSFIWDFGDPASGTTNNTSTMTIPTHTFSADGNYTVTLKNGVNNQPIATLPIVIGFTAPTIAGSTTICPSTFPGNRTTNNSVNLAPGQTAVWSITSGTGTISGLNNLSDVTVNWTSAGGTVSVTITNANGCTRTVNQAITESSTNCSTTCPGDVVYFDTEAVSPATHQVSGTITTNTNYLVNSGSTITLRAGNSIVMKPNSTVLSGSVFVARIQDCSSRSKTEEESEIQESSEMVLFPNPTKELVTIRLIDGVFKGIAISTIDGKTVFKEKFEAKTEFIFNTISLKSGIYIVSMQTDKGETKYKKLIKE